MNVKKLSPDSLQGTPLIITILNRIELYYDVTKKLPFVFLSNQQTL